MQQLVHGSKGPICHNYACEPMLIPLPPLSDTQNPCFSSFLRLMSNKYIYCLWNPFFLPLKIRVLCTCLQHLRTFLILYSASKKNKGFCLLISFVNSLHTLGQNPSVLGCLTMSVNNHILSYNLH